MAKETTLSVAKGTALHKKPKTLINEDLLQDYVKCLQIPHNPWSVALLVKAAMHLTNQIAKLLRIHIAAV